MKIAHEAPLSLMSQVRGSTDYCYALVHLFEEYPEYFHFFQESLLLGRKVILDNSIFELGQAFDSDRFVYWINRLQPTEYIIPDVLESSEKTISQLQDWISTRKVQGIKIGVVQGKTYGELVECYKAVNSLCDKIAISFDYSYYLTLFPYVDKWVGYALGRRLFLHKLQSDGILNTHKPHHLLGCSLPWEFILYRRDNWIETIDTSNPIVHSILGKKYGKLGLSTKSSLKLVELLKTPREKIDENLLKYNILIFQKLANENSNFRYSFNR